MTIDERVEAATEEALRVMRISDRDGRALIREVVDAVLVAVGVADLEAENAYLRAVLERATERAKGKVG